MELSQIAIVVVAGVVYMLPTIVANQLDHKNRQAIAVLNLFGGWTCIGWVGALVWSFTR